MRSRFYLMMALIVAAPAAGQTIDPATVTVPDVTMPRDKAAADALIANGWKYFFFHKTGATFDAATADIAFCQRYLPRVETISLPGYSDFSGLAAKRQPNFNQPYGVVGAVIGNAINKTFDRRDRVAIPAVHGNAGYTRYPMAEKVWESFDDRDPLREVAILAKLASGPKPDLPVPVK